MKKDGGGPSLGRGGSGAVRVRKPIQGKKRFFFADFIPERTGHISLVPRAVLFFRLTAFFSRDPV